jgi:hypothetical protein
MVQLPPTARPARYTGRLVESMTVEQMDGDLYSRY